MIWTVSRWCGRGRARWTTGRTSDARWSALWGRGGWREKGRAVGGLERTAKDLPATNHIAQAHHVQELALFSSFFSIFRIKYFLPTLEPETVSPMCLAGCRYLALHSLCPRCTSIMLSRGAGSRGSRRGRLPEAQCLHTALVLYFGFPIAGTVQTPWVETSPLPTLTHPEASQQCFKTRHQRVAFRHSVP